MPYDFGERHAIRADGHRDTEGSTVMFLAGHTTLPQRVVAHLIALHQQTFTVIRSIIGRADRRGKARVEWGTECPDADICQLEWGGPILARPYPLQV